MSVVQAALSTVGWFATPKGVNQTYVFFSLTRLLTCTDSGRLSESVELTLTLSPVTAAFFERRFCSL